MANLRTLALISVLTLLASCASAPLDPLTKAQASEVLDELEIADLLEGFEKESVEKGSNEADDFSALYDASDECEAVATFNQVVYQAGWGDQNRQSLAPALRDFQSRDAVEFTKEYESGDDFEYANLRVGLLTYPDQETAAGVMKEIEDNVESCSDLESESDPTGTFDFATSYTLIGFKKIDSGENDFIYEYMTNYKLKIGTSTSEVKTRSLVLLSNLGSNILAIDANVSDEAEDRVGITISDLKSAAMEIPERVKEIARDAQDA